MFFPPLFSLPSFFLLLFLLKFLYCVPLYDCMFLASQPSVIFVDSEILSPHSLMSICFLLILKHRNAQPLYDHCTKVSWICFSCSFILCMHTHTHTLTLYVYALLRAIIPTWQPKYPWHCITFRLSICNKKNLNRFKLCKISHCYPVHKQ